MTALHDAVTLKGTKLTSEGFLVCDAHTVRTGIQRYMGHEVERPDLSFVDVYRPEEEVFSAASLASFSHVPVTVEHPAVLVDSTNWKDLAVGESSSNASRDGERLKIPLIVKDSSAVETIESGKRALSAGYVCRLDWSPGRTPDGKPYDAVQRDIRINHIAIVAKGRAGPEFRIGDEDKPVTTLKFQGITIDATPQSIEAIQKLQEQVAQLTTDNLALVAEKVTKDAEIEELKARPNVVPLRPSVANDGKPSTMHRVSDSQAAYEKRLRDAWKS